jgi:hypothetical protein
VTDEDQLTIESGVTTTGEAACYLRWDAGADLAARTAVILGAPKDLPERVRGHNPYRAPTPGADQ